MRFGKLCVLGVLLAISTVDGSAPLPARPPRTSGGFIVNDSSISTATTTSSTSASASASGPSKPPAATEPPSFVSVGIRSGCAREKAATAATLRSKDVAGKSAASRLRGGSTWIPHPPVKLSRADLEHSQAKTISSTDPVSLHRPTESSSCNTNNNNNNNKGGGDDSTHHAAEFTVSKKRVMEDESVDPLDFEDDEEGAGAGASFGGGGGGGRVGAPSFPRALKKFAWVP